MNQHSPSHTYQGNEGTCKIHATAKVIINNVVCVMFPQGKRFPQSCNRFLDTDVSRFTGLTIEECTESGHFKIIWFWMLFETFRSLGFKPYGNMQSIVESVRASFKRSSRIPFEYQELMKTMLRKFETCLKQYTVVRYYFFEDVRSLKKVLTLCLQNKLYVKLALKDRTVDDGAGHSVVLVGEDVSHYHIKNSWHDTLSKVSKKDFFHTFELEGHPFSLLSFEVYITYKEKPITGSWAHMYEASYGNVSISSMHMEEWLQKHQKYKRPRKCRVATRKNPARL